MVRGLSFIFAVIFGLAAQAQPIGFQPYANRPGVRKFGDDPQNPSSAVTADSVAKTLCQQVYGGRIFRFDFLFDNQFRLGNPEPIFRDQLREVMEAAGACQSVAVTSAGAAMKPGARFADPSSPSTAVMTTNLGQQITFVYSFNSTGQVSSLVVKDITFPKVVIRTWSDVSAILVRLPGLATMTAGAFGRGLLDLRPATSQPIGNASSLYVMKALEEALYTGGAHWNDVFPIRQDWKSLPTGEMQTWPAGRMVTISKFAEDMIALNDNTATDHLIHLLGRPAVEAALQKGGMQNPQLPFLRTDEMFKLKWGAPTDWASKYIGMSTDDKRAMLESDLLKVNILQVGHNGLSMFQPTYIRDIEWQATTGDLCRVMQSFLVRRDPTVMKILGENTGVIDSVGSGKAVNYAAYKSGSEPGVLTMTYMILDRRNQWGCVSAAWSNPARNVNPWVLRDIVHKALKVYDPDL